MMKATIRRFVQKIAESIDPDVEVHKITFEPLEIPLSRPKPLSSSVELEHYQRYCPLNCHPSGQCDTHCHASDYYYRKYPDGIIRGQWYCKASPTLEEFEPDYRKKSVDRMEVLE